MKCLRRDLIKKTSHDIANTSDKWDSFCKIFKKKITTEITNGWNGNHGKNYCFGVLLIS